MKVNLEVEMPNVGKLVEGIVRIADAWTDAAITELVRAKSYVGSRGKQA